MDTGPRRGQPADIRDMTRSGEYKEVVKEIKELNWEALSSKELQELMYLSHVSAVEFAEALRIALQLHPDDPQLREMADGELETDNMPYGDYTEPGDHAAYLEHFLATYNITPSPYLQAAGDAYLAATRQLSDEVRAMSIFSREEELHGIFGRILEATDWSAPGLEEYKNYLEQHIEFDSQEGGHDDLTKQFPVDDRVKPFYEARREMYRAIPALFEKSDE